MVEEAYQEAFILGTESDDDHSIDSTSWVCSHCSMHADAQFTKPARSDAHRPSVHFYDAQRRVDPSISHSINCRSFDTSLQSTTHRTSKIPVLQVLQNSPHLII